MTRYVVVSRAWFTFMLTSVLSLWVGFGALAYVEFQNREGMNTLSGATYFLLNLHTPVNPGVQPLDDPTSGGTRL